MAIISRSGINKNLGFSVEDRTENIRRIAEVARLYAHSGLVVLASFISPTRQIRQMAAEIIGEQDFLEIFINAPLEECEKRDVKGLYQKARSGQIKGFTGIDSPYEAPLQAFQEIRTHEQTLEESVEQLYRKVLTEIQL